MNFFAFLILIFFSSSTFACLVDLSGVYSMRQNPLKAKFFAVGKVVFVEDSRPGLPEQLKLRYFLVERSWQKASLSKIPIYVGSDIGGCGSPQVIKNERYLFLHSEEIENNSKLGEGVTFSNSLFIPLRDAKEFMQKLATKTIDNGLENPAWRYCSNDFDCVRVTSSCGFSVSVNKRFKKDILIFLQDQKKEKRCPQNEKQEKINSKCIEYFCF